MYPIVTGVKFNLSTTVSGPIVPEYFSFTSLNPANPLHAPVYILGVRNVFLLRAKAYGK